VPEGYADWLAQLKGQIAQAQHCSKGQFGQQATDQSPWFHIVTMLPRLFSGQLQLADLVARPLELNYIRPKQANQAFDITAQKRTDEQRWQAIRHIINQTVVSERVVDILDAVGLDIPNIGLLEDEFLAQVKNLPERNLAVELLERLLEGEIKSKFATNVVPQRKFSDMLGSVISRYQNRSIETAQVMEELVDMAKKFKEAASRGEQLGLTDDEVRFYDALATDESAVRELTDETLKKIAQELTESLHKNITVDWSQRESVRAQFAADG